MAFNIWLHTKRSPESLPDTNIKSNLPVFSESAYRAKQKFHEA